MIKIYLGDQLANAVGRSKIAKERLNVLVLDLSLKEGKVYPSGLEEAAV